MARALAGLAGSACLVLAMVGAATRGYTALTTDAARALDVAAQPVLVPAVRLIDRFGTPHSIRDERRSTIVDFVYTRCVTVCSAMGGVFQALQSEVTSRGLGSRVRLLSVSFDPGWDTPERLGPYVDMLQADPAIWTIATAAERRSLPSLLQAFGVRVIDDGANGFVHNAALHVVAPGGRLVAILPVEAIGEALDVAEQHARPSAPRR